MTKNEWERLIKGAPIPLKDGNSWVALGKNNSPKDVSFMCAYSDDGGLYILLRSRDNIKEIRLSNNLTGNKAQIKKVDNWQEGENYFQTVEVDTKGWVKKKPGKFSNIVLDVKFDKEGLRWPEKGSAEFVLGD